MTLYDDDMLICVDFRFDVASVKLRMIHCRWSRGIRTESGLSAGDSEDTSINM